MPSASHHPHLRALQHSSYMGPSSLPEVHYVPAFDHSRPTDELAVP